MEKVLAGKINCDIFDEIFAQNGNIIEGVSPQITKRTSGLKTLSSCIKYFDCINDIHNSDYVLYNGVKNVCLNEVLSDKKTRKIAYELALAVDKNSVTEIKKIKSEYGTTKEFACAKEFLNKQCKQIWDVYENKTVKMNLPLDAMKALGITNRPDLDFLLLNSLKYYEKDNGSTTVNIISSILNNPNLNYSFEDIYAYLKMYYHKNSCKYNLKTVSYLIYKLDYSKSALTDLGVEENTIKQVVRNLPLKDRLIFLIKNFL